MLWGILEKTGPRKVVLKGKIDAQSAPHAMVYWRTDHPEDAANANLFARPWARRYKDSAQKMLASWKGE